MNDVTFQEYLEKRDVNQHEFIDSFRCYRDACDDWIHAGSIKMHPEDLKSNLTFFNLELDEFSRQINLPLPEIDHIITNVKNIYSHEYTRLDYLIEGYVPQEIEGYVPQEEEVEKERFELVNKDTDEISDEDFVMVDSEEPATNCIRTIADGIEAMNIGSYQGKSLN